jgi:acylphosphatase
MASLRRIHASVTGRVQGVSYRASTIEEARRLGVTGWVRNRGDGSVELEAQGAPAQVEALLAWCAVGPPAARVSEVTVKDLPIVDGERGFSFEIDDR